MVPGIFLLAIGGQRVDRNVRPNELLVNQAGQEVQLTVAESDGGSPRTVSVKALGNETPVRYRDWVEQNRKYVHEKSRGQVGYIHVPDMSADGYAEFHRYFLGELDHNGLIIDVRQEDEFADGHGVDGDARPRREVGHEGHPDPLLGRPVERRAGPVREDEGDLGGNGAPCHPGMEGAQVAAPA